MVNSAIVLQCSRLRDHIPHVNSVISECARSSASAWDDLILAASFLSQSSLLLDLLQHELAESDKITLSNEIETAILSVVERQSAVIMKFEAIARRQYTASNVKGETRNRVRELALLWEISVAALRLTLQVVSLRKHGQETNSTTGAVTAQVGLLEQLLVPLPLGDADVSAAATFYRQFIDTVTLEISVKQSVLIQHDPPPAYKISEHIYKPNTDLDALKKFGTLSAGFNSKLVSLAISEHGTTIGAVFASSDVVLWRLSQDHTSFVVWMNFKVPSDSIDSIQFLGNTFTSDDTAFVILHSSTRNVMDIHQTSSNRVHVSKGYVRNLAVVSSGIDRYIYYSWDNCLFRLDGHSDFVQCELRKFEAGILSVCANSYKAAVLCSNGMVHLISVLGVINVQQDRTIELMKWDSAAEKLNPRLYFTQRDEVVACWTMRDPLKGHNDDANTRLIFWNRFSAHPDSCTTRVFPSSQPAEVTVALSASTKYLLIFDGARLRVVELNNDLGVLYDQQVAQGTSLTSRAIAVRNQHWRLGKGAHQGLRDVTALVVQHQVPAPVKPSSWLKSLAQPLRGEAWQVADIYTAHLPGRLAFLE